MKAVLSMGFIYHRLEEFCDGTEAVSSFFLFNALFRLGFGATRTTPRRCHPDKRVEYAR